MLHLFHHHSHNHHSHTDSVHPHHHRNFLQKYYLSHHNKLIHMLRAIQESDLELMELLFSHGLSASSTLPCGMSLMHYATLFYEPDTINLLISRGADIDAVDFDNKTAIFYAAEHQKWDAFQTLFRLGANINIRADYCHMQENSYKNVLPFNMLMFKMGEEAGEIFWQECCKKFHRVTFL